METTKTYSISEVFEMIGQEDLKGEPGIFKKGNHTSINVDGYDVYRRSLRYQTFYNKGLKCVFCGKEGTHFRLDCDRNSDPQKTSRRHFNLYADDGTLMTKDHIKPKKWGGEDSLDNMQTMCQTCNESKGSIYEEPVYGIIAIRKDNPEKRKYFLSEEKAAYDMINNNSFLNNKLRPGILARKVINIVLNLHEAIEYEGTYFGYTWSRGYFNVEGKSFEED